MSQLLHLIYQTLLQLGVGICDPAEHRLTRLKNKHARNFPQLLSNYNGSCLTLEIHWRNNSNIFFSQWSSLFTVSVAEKKRGHLFFGVKISFTFCTHLMKSLL